MIQLKTTQTLNIDESRTICRNISVGRGTTIWEYVNLYDCKIGEDCLIGTFVEIQKGVTVGHRTRIQSHTFICEKVRIGNDCFISHSVMFINDTFRSGGPAHDPELWNSTIIEDNVSVGSNATIMPVTIGEGAVIGAGAVVIQDVPPRAVVAGNPARLLRYVDEEKAHDTNA